MKKYFRLLTSAILWLTVTVVSAQDSGKQLFDFDWKFNLGDIQQASAPGFNDAAWRNVDLPHDWSVEGHIDAKNPMGNDGGYFPSGIGWYRKTFDVPASWKGKHVSVYFGGVYMNAEVFVNGKSLGVYPYGYSSFSYDITQHLQPGKKNTIVVKADNSQQKNCRWYSGSGIYRHVWLMVDNDVHVQQWGVALTTEKVAAGNVVVKAKISVKNESDKKQKVLLKAVFLNSNGAKSGNAETVVALSPNSTKEVEVDVNVTNAQLWSTEKPNLYTAKIQLVKGKEVTDEVSVPFGVRTIDFSSEKGFILNGKSIKLNGGCVHHDNGALGAAAYDRAEERKVELLKAAGFNAVRTSHNPPSEAFLDACDRLGLLVIDESFDGWRTAKNKYDYSTVFDAWAERDVTAMVQRDRNHPSIIMWSIGNEIIERTTPEAVTTAKMLAAAVKKADASRPVTSAMTTWGQEGWEVFDPLMAAHDICGYNYQLHRAPSDHKRVPERVIVQTESYPRDAFANWQLVTDNNYIIGDFVWTAIDYLGESGIGRYYYPGEPGGQHWERDFYPWHGAYCGDVDLLGWRKPISHYRSMLYNDTEKLYLAVKEPNPAAGEIKETMWSVWPTWERWNWPGFEGKPIQVEVYSKYPQVRLYLNDKLVGEMAVNKETKFKAVFTVPYATGTLKAVGVQNGTEAESKILKTAGKASKIKLIADSSKIAANGQDLSYITVELTDENGVLQPVGEHKLTFSVKGQGKLIGVDNANLKDPDTYVAATRKTWNGRAQAVVKSTRNKGDIAVTVSAPGFADATVVVKSE